MKRLFAILLFLLSASWIAPAQTSLEELRRQIERDQKALEASNALLQSNLKEQQTNQRQLKLIRGNMDRRRNIVNNLNKQINLIDRDVTTKERLIAQQENQLAELKKVYGEYVYSAWKNYKLNNALTFLFAAKDFNDATLRIAYMRRYNRMREQKAEEIDSLTAQLRIEVEQLDARRVELDQTKNARSNELKALTKDETQYRNTVAALQQKEKSIASQIRQQQRRIEQAQAQIARIIAEQNRKTKGESRTQAQIDYDVTLTGRFDENKGRLPYPVRGGVIVDHYGIHPHATQKGMTVNNKGVNIAGTKAAPVKCVFEGVVTSVLAIPGLNKVVMVRHGNYVTVYANMDQIAVKTGENVSINQVLGYLSAGDNSDEYTLHFEIWKETTNLNPESWLAK